MQLVTSLMLDKSSETSNKQQMTDALFTQSESSSAAAFVDDEQPAPTAIADGIVGTTFVNAKASAILE